jgi:hypothetical protein
MNLSGDFNHCEQDGNKWVQKETGNDKGLTNAVRFGGFMGDKGLVEKEVMGRGARYLNS